MLFGCGKADYSPAQISSDSYSSTPIPTTTSIVEGEELVALAESEEEAKQIAELYGISLVNFSNGVATFHTEEDLSTIIEKGKENNWTILDINRVITID
jgi:hypothetical protein